MNCLWFKQIHYACVLGTVAQNMEAVFITGALHGDTLFGDTRLRCEGTSDVFLAKLDSNGNFLWVRRAGGPGYARADGVAVDSAGNSYITGQFRDQATFDGMAMKPQGGCDMFIAKYSPRGKLLWVKRDAGIFTEASAIAVDEVGNVFVTGYCARISRFGNKPLTYEQGSDMFLAKYDTSGGLLWVRTPGGPSMRFGQSIALDRGGNPYVVGSFFGTQAFGPTNVVIDDPTRLPNIFIAKYTVAGEFQWVRQFRRGDLDVRNVLSVESTGVKLPTRYSMAASGRFPISSSLPQPSADFKTAALAELDSLSNVPQNSKPSLRLKRSGEFIVLLWPKDFVDAILEASETLTPFPIWEVVPEPPEVIGGQMAVFVPISTATRFYRLRQP